MNEHSPHRNPRPHPLGLGRRLKHARIKTHLIGVPTIPSQIAANKQPYYDALRRADAAWAKGKIELSGLQAMLTDMLRKQLHQVVAQATG